jgi:polysaccharide biosynthesis protein PslH
MRILLLSNQKPLPANNGVKMRTWSILRALVEAGHEITLLTFESQECGDDSSLLARMCRRVVGVPHHVASLSLSHNHLGRLKRLPSRLPFGVESLKSTAMTAQIQRLLRESAIDAVFCEQTDLIVNLPADLPVPLVVDFHNVDYLILERYIRFERNPFKRLYAKIESRKLREWEHQCCLRATIGMACSQYDRGLLSLMNPNLSIFIVPNVIDAEEYRPAETEEPDRILFQGGMDWYPNRDAVEFFVAEVFPLVRRQIPRAHFVVAGRNPPEEFRQRLGSVEGVQFTGTVQDMRAEIQKAAVCVVPLRIGSGTRLKILESAAMAKPIISTYIGAEGLDFINGDEILLEDAPAGIAGAIAQLLSDSSKRRALGLAARKRLEETYSFAPLRTCLQSAMAALHGGSSAKQDTNVLCDEVR